MLKRIYRHDFGHAFTLDIDCDNSIHDSDDNETEYKLSCEISLRKNSRFPNIANQITLTQSWKNTEYNEPEDKEGYIVIDLNKFDIFQAFIDKIGEEIETLRKESDTINPMDFPIGRIIYLLIDNAKNTYTCPRCKTVLYPLSDEIELIRNQEEKGEFLYYCHKCRQFLKKLFNL